MTIRNRIAILGSLVAGLGFFFLPLIELKPNRIASGVSFNLLQLQGDARFWLLFVLALIPLIVALYDSERGRRAWILIGLGHLLIFLTLLLPALAGQDLIANAAELLPEDVRLRNPRILPSAAIALGAFGGYIVVFAGLRDLQHEKIPQFVRYVAMFLSLPFIILMFVGGNLDIYSVMVEYQNNGDLLGQRFIEHITFVMVSLVVGAVMGIGFGLWASRDERLSPVILYVVGIIQTIPSLALFGILLVPLARFGDQLFSNVLLFFIILVLIASGFLLFFIRIYDRMTARVRTTLTIAAAILVAIPLVIFIVILVSFLFRITLPVLTDTEFATNRNLIFVLILLALGTTMIRRWFVRPENTIGQGILRYALIAVTVIAALFTIATLYQSAQQFLRFVESYQILTIRDLGVSGIGVAPALIALTLYSLLPIVRNTYAGLNNVDPAIIDSGRGMGMTPPQIFLQIELPLAFPVIMAGVRNAAIALVGIGVIATVIGAGGLGDFVIQGILNISIDLILLGAIPAIFLAFALDWALRAFEAIFTSPGIRFTQNIRSR